MPKHEQADGPLDDQEVQIITLPGAPKPTRFRISRGLARLGLRLGIIISILLLLALTFSTALPLLRGVVKLPQLLAPPPSLKKPASEAYLYIDRDIPWTAVKLDHQPLRLPGLGSDAPVRIQPGRHLIEWYADPFPPKACVISVPLTTGDTCDVNVSLQTPAGPLARLIVLHDGLKDLLPAQQTSLLMSLKNTLATTNFSETVHSGEQYAQPDGPQVAKQASQNLRATFNLRPQIDASGQADPGCQLDARSSANQPCSINGQLCVSLCSLQAWQIPGLAYTYSGWFALGIVHPTWDFATTGPAGQLLAANVAPEFTDLSGHLALFRIRWNSATAAWTVNLVSGPLLSPPLLVNGIHIADDPACVNALNTLMGELWHYAWFRYVSSPNPATGCLIEASGNGTTKPAESAFFLDRFGVVLTANKLAQQTLPLFPRASSDQQNLVHQLEALPGQRIRNIP